MNAQAPFELHSNTLTPINWPDLETSEKSFVFLHFFFFFFFAGESSEIFGRMFGFGGFCVVGLSTIVLMCRPMLKLHDLKSN